MPNFQSLDKPFIVADIGGTNARFGLVTAIGFGEGVDADRCVSQNRATQFQVEFQKVFPSNQFDRIEDVFGYYVESLDKKEILGACLAVAGPVVGGKIKLTNLNWEFEIEALKKQLGLNQLFVINDFAAYAYSIQYVSSNDLRVINSGDAVENSPVAVIGPGTGFGVAGLIHQNGQLHVLPTEAGHMSLAANTPVQAAIIEQLTRKYSLVSVERIFSGPGLRHLYHAYAAVEGTQSHDFRTAEISQYALDGSDEMCQRTLALFCSWLGSVTGDLALALGARGGIFLGGGILPRIADFLIESDFQQSFKAKDQMSDYLENIPVQLVTQGNSALFGAAAWFQQFNK